MVFSILHMAYQGSKSDKIKIFLCLLVIVNFYFYNFQSPKKQKETFSNFNANNSQEPLQLECVLGAVNTNPKYLHFIPLFIKKLEKVLSKNYYQNNPYRFRNTLGI